MEMGGLEPMGELEKRSLYQSVCLVEKAERGQAVNLTVSVGDVERDVEEAGATEVGLERGILGEK